MIYVDFLFPPPMRSQGHARRGSVRECLVPIRNANEEVPNKRDTTGDQGVKNKKEREKGKSWSEKRMKEGKEEEEALVGEVWRGG